RRPPPKRPRRRLRSRHNCRRLSNSRTLQFGPKRGRLRAALLFEAMQARSDSRRSPPLNRSNGATSNGAGFGRKLVGCPALPMSLLVGCGWPRRRSFNYFFNGMFVCSHQFGRWGELEKATPTQEDRDQSTTKFTGRRNYTPQKAILYR